MGDWCGPASGAEGKENRSALPKDHGASELKKKK